jgi:flavin-dependent dehydrogenase
MKMHVTEMDIEGLEMHTGGSSVKGGYVGLSPVENGRVNLCGLFEVNKKVTGKGAEKIHGYLMSMGLKKLAIRLESANIDEKSFSAVAGFSMGHQKILENDKHGVLPVGDAAILIPPFTGNGMSIALESALLAGQCLLPYCHDENNTNWDKTRKTYLYLLRKKFRKRLIAAKFIHPFFFHRIGKWCLRSLAKCKLIPFRGLFYLLR